MHADAHRYSADTAIGFVCLALETISRRQNNTKLSKYLRQSACICVHPRLRCIRAHPRLDAKSAIRLGQLLPLLPRGLRVGATEHRVRELLSELDARLIQRIHAIERS